MKNINRLFNVMTLYIILLFSISIGGTYLSDYLNDNYWLGDQMCIRTRFNISNIYNNSDVLYHKHGDDKHYKGDVYITWGARHYWYNYGLFVLWCVSLIRGVVSSIDVYKKE